VALKNHFGSDYSHKTLDGITDAVLTAALKAWTETGMAQTGVAAMVTLEGEPKGKDWWQNVLIISTEAPRT
jgi:hypothetical protein